MRGEDNENRPLISSLLDVPELRQRYLAHTRTIINESLDWSVLSPRIQAYINLIEEEVKADTLKLTSDTAFDQSFTEFQNFVSNRRNYLLSYAEIDKEAPEIISVKNDISMNGSISPTANDSVRITVEVGAGVEIGEVILYYADGPCYTIFACKYV